ncbi:TPA: iron ABC transporter permease [Bacillus cereus]|nr:iron ABC transporter permease [Bacillus cereus]
MRTSVLTKKNISILTILVGLIVSIFLISLNTGTFKIPPMDVLKSLVGLGAEDQSVILFEFRMPRMVIAILVGIAVAAGFGAVSLIFSMKMTSNDFRFATIWLAGSLWGTDWKFVLSVLPWMVIFLPLAISKAHILNVMNLGDSTAVGLGVNVEKERRKLLFIAVCLAGASVAVAGGIGFIGLMAPHLARRLVGGKHQIMLPTAALIGTFLLLFADVISRSVLTTSEIPVGLVISVIGAPYFIYLLMRTK